MQNVHRMNMLKSNTWDFSQPKTKLPTDEEFLMLMVRSTETHTCRALCTSIEFEKAKLDILSSGTYQIVRSASDPFERLCSHLQKRCNVAQCNRGWLKMYEMIVVNRLMDFKKKGKTGGSATTVYALFNCELPGGFICATNHYLMSKDLHLEWLASSLHPLADNTALDDSFGLMAKYPERWLMTSKQNSNGDMTRLSCIRYLVEETKKKIPRIKRKLDLYVADGGMDIADNYNKQECIHQALVLGELLTCMQTLVIGGNAVIKMYAFCTDFMRSLVACASKSFEQCYISKPLTSRPINSEVYLILIHYTKMDSQLVDHMSSMLEDVAKAARDFVPAESILTMSSPEVAAFTSVCIRALGSIGDMLRVTIDAHIDRSKHMKDKKIWKNVNLGPMDMQGWLNLMSITDLNGSSNL